MTGSKKGGDYCWNVYAGSQSADPWYLGGTERRPEATQDPSPEDSAELEPVRDA